MHLDKVSYFGVIVARGGLMGFYCVRRFLSRCSAHPGRVLISNSKRNWGLDYASWDEDQRKASKNPFDWWYSLYLDQ